MKKAVIYTRQSSGDDDYSESIEVQKKNCFTLANQKNIEIIGEYQDLNSSGKLYPTGFEELAAKDVCYQNWLKDVSSRKTARNGLGEVFKLLSEIDYIIVDDYTRLARPLTGSFLDAIITQSLSANNIKVLTVKSGEIDLTAFNDSLITALQSRINDNQIAIQRKKSKDGLKRLKDAGVNRQGISRILGFKSTGRKHEIECIPREVECVKFIYEQFLSGVAINEIAKRLNENFNDVFSKAADRHVVRKALLRPFYCGYMYDSGGNLIRSQQVAEKAFISFSDWQKAKAIFDIRKTTKPRQKHNWNPCCGYVFCGKCGSKMILRGGNTRSPFYSCTTHLKIRREPCRGNLSATQNNDYGLGLFETIAPLLVIGAQEKLRQISIKNDLRADVEKLNVKLNNLLEKEKRFTELFMKGLIEDSIYETSLAELTKNKVEVKTKLIEMQATVDSSDDEESTRKLLRKVVAGKISHGDFEELFRLTVKRIEITAEKVTVKTVAGDVSLPRQKLNRYNLLPHFTFANQDNEKLTLYFYYGEKRLIANIYSQHKTKIATLGNLNIHYIKG